MATVTDSAIFSTIFSTPAASAIWSDTTRTAYYLRFEAALAVAQADAGLIPKDAAQAIVAACDVERIDMAELARDTAAIGYPVLGVVRQIVRMANATGPGLGEWAHWGATTQDVTDTATVLQLRDTLDLVDDALAGIAAALAARATEHLHTPMAARSNLQQAVPITFGFKLARVLAAFQRHRERLAQLRPRLLVLQFGGAAGTLASLPAAAGAPLQRALAAALGLGVPAIAWHTERDSIAEAGTQLALLLGTCAKLAGDVALLMQSEVGEVLEPFAPHRGSSSTMPQKRNPIACAYIHAMAATARQLAAGLLGAVVADHERSTGPWEVEWIALPQLATLACAALGHTRALAEGLEVRPAAMAANLAQSRGAVVSEAVMMALGAKIGRQVAHDLVYDLCLRAGKEERPLLDLLWESEEVRAAGISQEELAALCEPANYLGLSVEMTESVLARQREIEQENTV